MTASRNLLVFGGIALAAFGMSYGLHYALFVEHQTLDRMGGSLMQAFVRAAERQMPQAHDAIGTYASAKYDYVRQVDVHSHWTGLAMLMIVLGIAFDGVAFSERVRTWIAGSLLGGSVLFPFGVILQTASHGSVFGSALAIAGSALVTLALAAAAWGFTRQAT
ncbi:MAG: hypothetical protein LAO24_03535 [Acidobacteriia bacterium]|nr:hypothetical protein [Terriglobia bacterium]